MPHISSKKINEKDLQKIYTQFISALEKSSGSSTTRIFLNEFLTKTEKIMFAKRFSVIYLLSKDLPHSYIAECLHMSPATIQRMSLKYEIGKYRRIVISKKSDKMIWEILEKVLRAGLPPVAGRGRWKYLYKISPQDKE